MIKHIAIVMPSHFFSTRDVGVGLSEGFRKIGYHVTDINYNTRLEYWRGIWDLTNEGDPSKKQVEQMYERATGDVLFQLIRNKPDLVIIVDGTQLHVIFWAWMRELGLRSAVVMTDCPYQDVQNAYVAEKCEFAFANDILSARKMGAIYLPMAYRETIHHPMIVAKKYKSDVVFVGSGFQERIKLLEAVDFEGIDFKLLGHWGIDDSSPIKKFNNQDSLAVPNEEVAQYYNGAKLVLDLDRTSIDFGGALQVDGRGSAGPRIYEAAACSCAIVAQDNIEEISSVLGGNYIPFHTPDELSSLLREWLHSDKEEARAEMGRNARKAVEHESYTDRAIRILECIQG